MTSMETAGTIADAPPENPPGLPSCHYRRRNDGADYRCLAAEGAVVTGDDCRRCAIPEAVAHPQACLYLVPMRHENEARFACPWYFTWAREPAVRDWHDLCFCQYWFPRGADDRFILDVMRERRARYLRVLRGEEPRSKRLNVPPAGQEHVARRATSLLLRLWRTLLARLGFRPSGAGEPAP